MLRSNLLRWELSEVAAIRFAIAGQQDPAGSEIQPQTTLLAFGTA